MTSITPQQLVTQLLQLLPEKRIIFLHPNFNQQHLILSHTLPEAAYVRFQGQDLDETQLQSQFGACIKAQSGQSQPDASVKYVILDEVDRARPKVFARFLKTLVSNLRGGHILVLSRVFLPEVLEDQSLRRLSGFIPIDTNNMLWDYAHGSDETLLEVRAFGEGRVHVNGQDVNSWDGALPRALFFYLVDRGMVTRAEIFQTFWSGLTTREATNVFHVTKRKISEVLGTELTTYGSGFYHISPKIQLSYDVSLFNQLVQDSDGDEGDVFKLRQAISLYRGDYLLSLKSDWVLARRESLQQSVCDAMIALGKMNESSGDQAEALGYYLRAARLKPEREDAAYAIMRLYQELRLPEAAHDAYQRLAATLKKRLKVEPSAHVQKLAEQLAR